jgi:nucleotide-binding universal stress UspA family protein
VVVGPHAADDARRSEEHDEILRRGGCSRRADSGFAGQRRGRPGGPVAIAVSAPMHTIVVGVDGSDGGAAALEYAAGEAAFRGARLRIVSAWQVPLVVYGSGFAPPLDGATLDGLRERARQVADDALEGVKRLQPSLEADALEVQGQPADVLLEEGAGATLIVVGRRGLGGFRSLLLGSVSQQVVQHATCPVVVVNQPATTS